MFFRDVCLIRSENPVGEPVVRLGQPPRNCRIGRNDRICRDEYGIPFTGHQREVSYVKFLPGKSGCPGSSSVPA
jgi:hypothetical protein